PGGRPSSNERGALSEPRSSPSGDDISFWSCRSRRGVLRRDGAWEGYCEMTKAGIVAITFALMFAGACWIASDWLDNARTARQGRISGEARWARVERDRANVALARSDGRADRSAKDNNSGE